MAYNPQNPNGQATSANSAPVVIASDQTAVPVSASSLPLPSGAASSALQTSGNASLSAIETSTANIPPLGQALAAASVPVVLTAAQLSTLTPLSSVSVSNFPATQAISAASLPLPTGAATSALQTLGNSSLNTISGQLPTTLGANVIADSLSVNIASNQTVPVSVAAVGLTGSTAPTSAIEIGGVSSAGTLVPAAVSANVSSRNAVGVVVTPAQQTLFRTTFAAVLPSNVDSEFFTRIQAGTGQTVAQSAGNLLLTSGTTANAETILRSTASFTGSLLSRIQTILSQRIANNNFFVELVDVIGDGLVTTVNSATSITVTIPGNPFTSTNVGQSMYVGACQNISATAVPGRYAIASVSGNNVTFTVAGWPATGSGTVSLFGWNYYQLQYQGVTATAVNYDAQRKGWNSGFTAATINTTASPGHMAILANNDGSAYFADQLIASTAGTVQTSMRASRVVNLAEENTPLFLQIRAVNGSTAPASTTTWTVGMASVENYAARPVVINDVKATGAGSQVPVAVTNTPAVTVSSGTITTVTNTTNNGTTYTNADQASAAITTTTNGGTITVANGTSVAFNIAITVVSGTLPTYNFSVQESGDGTNWTTIYAAPRFTTTGFFTTASIKLNHNRYRIVETIGGTTPSFTRAITSSRTAGSNVMERYLVDTTIAPATALSTSASLNVDGCTTYGFIALLGAGGTGNIQIALDGSDDNVNWVNGLTFVNVVAAQTSPVQCAYSASRFRFIRARVVTAQAASTIGYLTLFGTQDTLQTLPGRRVVTQFTAASNTLSTTYTQIVASTIADIHQVETFDSSGSAFILGVGAAASEVTQLYVFPGGAGPQPLFIPAGSRVAIRTVTGTPTSGTFYLNAYGV